MGRAADTGFRELQYGDRNGDLREHPGGIQFEATPRYRKYSEDTGGGTGRGFGTPSGRVELYSEVFLEHGQQPLPGFVHPMPNTMNDPATAEEFPLVMTSFKPGLFCQSQHRGIAQLRRRHSDPVAEIHPTAATEQGISSMDWVSIETPHGTARARAHLNEKLDPGVICVEHGWWEGCAELGMRSTDVTGPDSSNYNALIGNDVCDPISGSVPLRSFPCRVRNPLADAVAD